MNDLTNLTYGQLVDLYTARTTKGKAKEKVLTEMRARQAQGKTN